MHSLYILTSVSTSCMFLCCKIDAALVKENLRKRPLDAPGGLARQVAVRKRKDEVHEMNGHKFIQRQFYQIILCAFCNEFLLNAVGYQCEDCRYTCHKKCYEKVVTKCISKSNNGVSIDAYTKGQCSRRIEQDDDAEKINHRIPHRFEPITNIGANWCCHCGYMLPLGRKNARRCTECSITCHANCAHLVPDFCGMSMETANQLLRQWRIINQSRGGRTTTQSSRQSNFHQQPSPRIQLSQSDAVETLTTDIERMKMAEPPLPQKDTQYARPQTQTPPPESLGPQAAQVAYAGQQQTPPGGRSPSRPAFPTEPVSQRAAPTAYEQQEAYGYQVCIKRHQARC